MRILLLTAPMVQINTPYPASAYLKGFLEKAAPDLQVEQADLGILLVNKIFSETGLKQLAKKIGKKTSEPQLKFFQKNLLRILESLAPTLKFLRHPDAATEKKILSRAYLPEGARFQSLQGAYYESFAALEPRVRAQHLASLFLDDLADCFRMGDDPRFEFSRYGEKLAASQPSFDPLLAELSAKPTLLDTWLWEIAKKLHAQFAPQLIGISAPFSGTVYAALRVGKFFRDQNVPVVLGGGYPNTELRRLSDPRVFDFVDYITLDDGEKPLLSLIERLQGKNTPLLRTFHRDNQKVLFATDSSLRDIPFPETGTPDYAGLPLSDYLPMHESLNPVNRLWSGEFWNKLTLAHGCYWHRCSFCDTTLDYIGRYEAEKAENIADKMQAIAEQTKCRGFHFVDEAAPPAILRALSEELLKRKSSFEWWGNIRFDKAFTPALALSMKEAGCIAVTGGLEVASPRVLKLIDKGVSLEQVTKVTRAFRDAGVFVHAYLMFGFPSQTVQETVDSLEVVRQLFLHDCLQSAFWHRFACTAHSPVGKNPDKYGIKIHPVPKKYTKNGLFAENDLYFTDSTGVDHDALGEGLRKALFNFMHGNALDWPVHEWFAQAVPKTKIPAKLIASYL